MIVANLHEVEGRIELFGLVFFETLVAALAFTQLKKLHDLRIFAAIGVVYVSIVNDLDCLRVWKLGFDAEKMLWNRVLARMEMQKDFVLGHKYRVFQIGGSSCMSLRTRFFDEGSLPKGKAPDAARVTLLGSYEPPSGRLVVHEFYYPVKFIGENPRFINLNDPQIKAQFRQLWEAGILDKAQAWPHENGLIVWKDVILFITDAKALENCKKQLAQEFPRQHQNTP